jgi:hypothetical protein
MQFITFNTSALKQPRVEPILAGLPEIQQRGGLSDFIDGEVLTTKQHFLGLRGEAMLQRLALEWANHTQSHGRGDQPTQVKKAK